MGNSNKWAGCLATNIRGTLWVTAVVAGISIAIQPVLAETVEVTAGVRVTKKVYSAPVNEQPFFGFSEKSEQQREADNKFVADVLEITTRQQAFDGAIRRGWKELASGEFDIAAKRFNQAFLLMPEQSEVYHGFAAVAQARFADIEYADELFRQALKQPNPAKTLNADYGRFLLSANRPRDARPVLEQAVLDAPDLGDAWSNLASARLQTGEKPAACAAANEAVKRNPWLAASSDYVALRRQANCD